MSAPQKCSCVITMLRSQELVLNSAGKKGRDTQPGEAGYDPTADKGTWAHGVQKPTNWLAVLWHKLILYWLTLYHKPGNLRKQGWAWAKHYSILVDYGRPSSYA